MAMSSDDDFDEKLTFLANFAKVAVVLLFFSLIFVAALDNNALKFVGVVLLDVAIVVASALWGSCKEINDRQVETLLDEDKSD